jgi:TctA family transporter
VSRCAFTGEPMRAFGLVWLMGRAPFGQNLLALLHGLWSTPQNLYGVRASSQQSMSDSQ